MCVCVNYSSVNYISLTFSLPVHFVCVCVCWLVGLVQITPRRRTLYRKFFQFHRHLVSLFYLLHQHDIYFHLCIALSLFLSLVLWSIRQRCNRKCCLQTNSIAEEMLPSKYYTRHFAFHTPQLPIYKRLQPR